MLSGEAGNINSVNCRFISNKIILTVIPNIDSVRIKSTSTTCNSFNLNGLAFTNTSAINKWEWFFDDGTTASIQNTTHTYTTQGNHPIKLVVTDMNGCKDSTTTILNAVALPANPTYTITEPTCSNAFGSINITIPIAPSLLYSINGTGYQSSPVFSNLAMGSYNLTVKDNNSGCISLPINLNINAATIPANAKSNVTQPSCSNSSGTITVTSPLGSNLQYSIDDINYQTVTVFNNVTTGSYNLTVKNTTTGCVSLPATVVIDPPLSVPALPVANAVQPVCNNDKGSFIVISPVRNGIEYSINNINFQPSVNFSNLAPASYSLIAKNTNSGCTSVAATIVISAGTGTPSAPVGIVSKQPDCIVNTGTISINSPLGSNYNYSINNSAYQTTTNFSNLTPGNYGIVVKNISNGCISPGSQFTVNAIPTPPADPSTNIIQPTCAVTTGTINITSPAGSNMQYSINNSVFQAAASFTSLAPGSYSLIVKNTLTQCVSSATIAIVEVVPSPPSAPIIGNITNPSCSLPKGSIEMASPAGTNFEYSINGSNYQASNKFINLDPGTYNFTVRNIATSCVSSSTPATVNSGPAAPPVPTARTTVQPTCIISEGTIVVSSPMGSNFEYSIDGQTYQSTAVFEKLAPKTFYITVKDLSTGCISQQLPLTLAANINSPGKYLIPTAFTPNKDGINECFGIKYWGVISEFQLIIYNRWGQTVFSTNNPNDCWDGKYKGTTASQGNYVYYIKAKTLCGPVEKKGNVLLIR
jgi:gliding motility-associated-like protein